MDFSKTHICKLVEENMLFMCPNTIKYCKILLLPPTSAAFERSFSRQSWIHNQKRNRLTNDRASKLVFLSHNLELENQKCDAESSTIQSQNQEFNLDNVTAQNLESGVSSDSEVSRFNLSIEDLTEQESQDTE